MAILVPFLRRGVHLVRLVAENEVKGIGVIGSVIWDEAHIMVYARH